MSYKCHTIYDVKSTIYVFISVWKPVALISGVAPKPTVQGFFRSVFRSSSRVLPSTFKHESLSRFQSGLYLRQYLDANSLIYGSLNLRTYCADDITSLISLVILWFNSPYSRLKSTSLELCPF